MSQRQPHRRKAASVNTLPPIGEVKSAPSTPIQAMSPDAQRMANWRRAREGAKAAREQA